MSWRRLTIAVFAASLRAQPTGGGCDFANAFRLQQTGDLTAAKAGYEACLAADPGRVDARSNLGAVLVKMGRYQDAIGQYLEGLKTASPDVAPRLRFNLALAYYKSFEISEAAVQFEALHAAQPED